MTGEGGEGVCEGVEDTGVAGSNLNMTHLRKKRRLSFAPHTDIIHISSVLVTLNPGVANPPKLAAKVTTAMAATGLHPK